MLSQNLPEGALNELLYADYLVLMSETIEGLRNNFTKWKEAFESKGFGVNFGNTNVMVSGGITKDGTSKSMVGPSVICCLRVKANSILCLLCGKWIHGGCSRVKIVTPRFSRNLACIKCDGNIEEKLTT